MVKFCKFLESNLNKNWEKNYIDYNLLKGLIKKLLIDKNKYNNSLKKTFLNNNNNVKNTINIPDTKRTNPIENETLLIKSKAEEYLKPVIDITQREGVSHVVSLRTKNTEILEGLEELLNSDMGKFIKEFVNLLDSEIKKFFLFYKHLEVDLYSKINQFIKKEFKYGSYMFSDIFKELLLLEDICFDLFELCQFVNLNVTGVKKILTKFDNNFKLNENPIALYYLGIAYENQDSGLLYVLKFKVIDDCSALLEKMVADIEYIFKEKLYDYSESDRYITKNQSQNYANSLEIEDALNEPLIQKELKLDELISNNKTELLINKFKNKIYKLKLNLENIDNANDIIRSSAEIWTLNIQNNLRFINNSINHNALSADFVSNIVDKQMQEKTPSVLNKNPVFANDKLIIKNLTPHIETLSKDKNQFRREMINIWICLFHTCFNSINTCIIFPTNSKYISSIGKEGFLTGIVLSASHFAALGVTFIYSSWTNYNYKSPLLLSSLLYIIGNISYALSGRLESIYLMIIGRFLMGLGSARVVNRRYLLDHIDEKYILHYSMMYVVMTCVGNFAGPAIAILVIYLLPNYSFLDNWLLFNEYTWPVWICIIVWILFYFFSLIFFIDPYSNIYYSSSNNKYKLLSKIKKNSKSNNSNSNNNSISDYSSYNSNNLNSYSNTTNNKKKFIINKNKNSTEDVYTEKESNKNSSNNIKLKTKNNSKINKNDSFMLIKDYLEVESNKYEFTSKHNIIQNKDTKNIVNDEIENNKNDDNKNNTKFTNEKNEEDISKFIEEYNNSLKHSYIEEEVNNKNDKYKTNSYFTSKVSNFKNKINNLLSLDANVNNIIKKDKNFIENNYNKQDNKLVLVERDLKSIIKEQKTNIFSYMTVSFSILVLILTVIKVIFIYLSKLKYILDGW